MKNKEWNEFSVGLPSKRSNWTNKDCFPFSSVSHVTHIDNSLTILGDQKIKSGLVYDDSLLNRHRILVTWLSPKLWGSGYRYGNVRFNYEWDKIIKNKRFYWVEIIRYDIPACRILITDKKYSDLLEYDPENKEGPWWYDTRKKRHYHNDNCCLEFMVETDLKLTSDVRIDFVDHHNKWCSIHRYNPQDCPEVGLPSWTAAGIFLSNILARSIDIPFQLFKNDDNDEKISKTLRYCWSALCFYLTEADDISFIGKTTHKDEIAMALSRAICNAYANSSCEEWKKLISIFKSKNHLAKSLAKLIALHFDLDDWQGFIEK